MSASSNNNECKREDCPGNKCHVLRDWKRGIRKRKKKGVVNVSLSSK